MKVFGFFGFAALAFFFAGDFLTDFLADFFAVFLLLLATDFLPDFLEAFLLYLAIDVPLHGIGTATIRGALLARQWRRRILMSFCPCWLF